MKLIIPEKFNKNEIISFLDKIQFIYKSQYQKNFQIDLAEIKEISILGMLVIYKFISYTAQNKVFYQPNIIWDGEGNVEKLFGNYGFIPLLNNFINYSQYRDRILDAYKSLKGFGNKTLFCEPHSMLRDDENNRNELEQVFLNRIAKFYSQEKNDVVSLCTSELILNFWAHATKDTDSIVVAKGGLNYFNLYLIDSGIGMISNLKQIEEYKNFNGKELLELAFEKGVSSKPNTNHQGRGLYLVRELVKLNKGELDVYTEGYQYRIKEGVVTINEAPYWKGVILELKLRLNKPKDITHINQGKFIHSIRRKTIC